MASLSARRALRRIPALRSLSRQELKGIQDRVVYRSYRSGEVLWRTHARLDFVGMIQNGEIELEYCMDGTRVRAVRLRAGDPVPPRNWLGRNPRASLRARALTDVRLCLVPEAHIEQLRQTKSKRDPGPLAAGNTAGIASPRWVWPLLLFLLIAWFARADVMRIASGLLFVAANRQDYYPPQDPRSMSLLRYAGQVDQEAAFVYNEEGYRWFQQGRQTDAEAAFAEAIQKDGASAPALNNMAVTYFNSGDLSQAASYLQQAVEQDPNSATARYNLGIIWMQQDDPARAIREFRAASFIEPKAAASYLHQAFLYVELGDYTSAERYARTAIQLDPAQPSAHLLLGIALYNQGRYPEALDSVADTLQLEPEDRVARFYQAHILVRVEQYEAALPILEELLATSTDAQQSARISVEIEALHRSLAERAAGAR